MCSTYTIFISRSKDLKHNFFFNYSKLLFQHQQQVLAAIERAKQVTMADLNAIIGVSLVVTLY